MKNYEGYLIDLDGTMYKGQHCIESATEFIDELYQNNIPYLFLTNSSTNTQEEVVNKLIRLGIKSTLGQVFSSSLATAKYIRQHEKKARCMVIGERGLHDALLQEGLIITDQSPDYVVIGLDREITYEKLAKASLAIRNGATFISTNNDSTIPTERGLVPGNGALTSVITTATRVKPTFIGKPETIIMEEALTILNLPKEKVLMVGDNYHTDILAGINSDIDTLLVFTGVTSHWELTALNGKPTYHVDRLQDWIKYI